MDYWMGQVIDAIKARGWYNNSLMIFLSDHGDMMNDHFLWSVEHIEPQIDT